MACLTPNPLPPAPLSPAPFASDALASRARSLVGLYQEMGVASTKLIFRVPATWAGIQAAAILEKEGIATQVFHIYRCGRGVSHRPRAAQHGGLRREGATAQGAMHGNGGMRNSKGQIALQRWDKLQHRVRRMFHKRRWQHRLGCIVRAGWDAANDQHGRHNRSGCRGTRV